MRRGVLWAALALGAVGCANARYVHKDANGGVIAMSSNSSENRKKAEQLIRDHVGPGYQIVEEREVVTGQEKTDHSDTQSELGVHSKLPFLPAEKQTTRTTTTTRDLTEWQIVYQRAGGPPAAAAPPVQPAGARAPATK